MISVLIADLVAACCPRMRIALRSDRGRLDVGTLRRGYPQICAQPTSFLPMVSYLLSSSSRGCGYCGKASFSQVAPEIFVHRPCVEPVDVSTSSVDSAKLSPPDPQVSTVCAQVIPKTIMVPGDKILTRNGDSSTDHAGCAQRLSTLVHRLWISAGVFPQPCTQPPRGPGTLACVPSGGCG